METHHAYVYYGGTIADLPTALQRPSADVVHITEAKWGISESRAVIQAALLRPVTDNYRSIVLIAHSLTNEAQQALLKILEEPPSTAQFHLLVPNQESLLETVRSRLAVAKEKDRVTEYPLWAAFKTLPIADRLAEVAARTKAKDALWLQATVAGAIADSDVPARTRLLLDTYGNTRGASLKLLLEEVALSLPK